MWRAPVLADGSIDWRSTHRELAARDPADRSAEEREALADALFWLDRREDSVAARRDAYRAHVDAGDDERAALAAWRNFYEHHLVGEAAPAAGWLERCRRHVGDRTGGRAGGWLALAEADLALGRGEPELSAELAGTARAIGDGCDDRDLWAMALQAEGRAEIDLGRQRRGLGLLDEAMVSVINDELAPLYVGWVYCNVIATCYGLADLRRATEWSDAAMRWCASLRDGRMYPGLCRVYAVELACLRGAWTMAEADANRACEELDAHDPRYASAAYYLVGELHRLRGAHADAEAAYAHAHELGLLPQPGLALLRHAQGRPLDAAAGLRSALEPGPAAPLPRAQLLAAVVEVGAKLDDPTGARQAVAEMAELADTSGSGLIRALSAMARGRLALAAGDASAAIADLRAALHTLGVLRCPYEAARARVLLADAARAMGDRDTAHLELRAAITAFEQLGAGPDAADARRRHAEADVDGGDAAAPTDPTADHGNGAARTAPQRGAPDPLVAALSHREIEVLRLVADGSTNRQIADALVVSPHTVARHVSNIFTKLGVGSRSAATAFAYEHGLVGTGYGHRD